jgi:hypothetical protein
VVAKYDRLATIPPKDVLDAIANKKPLVHQGVKCDTFGIRLLTYRVHGTNCCVLGCKVKGEYFAIETLSNLHTPLYHLNLYGVADGREVMLTSDHRIPKSRGGSNSIDNRQPMCCPHNAKKGNKLIYL